MFFTYQLSRFSVSNAMVGCVAQAPATNSKTNFVIFNAQACYHCHIILTFVSYKPIFSSISHS